MSNRLADASSPYLLQHQHNPVDWYPWCTEALTAAKAQDCPIFLSIGYSACHWCHVMERESFENPRIAELLNSHFVSIKVDREERPDLDHIYMQAVQMLTGSGGWPMNLFLTPEGKPFFGGTYWPPEDRWGKPGFASVLTAVQQAWLTQRDQLIAQGSELTGYIQAGTRASQIESATDLQASWLDDADRWHREHFDPVWGGFGRPPKFPHCMALSLMIERCQRNPIPDRQHVVCYTLDRMAAGGIYDHLAGGFARYSVDEKWLVPHFEKMLYDNALLAACYADAYRLWRDETYGNVAHETLDYLIRDMQLPAGGVCSAEDADSEGVEGKFYVWTREQIEATLGFQRAEEFCRVYDVTANGNFEGLSILNLPIPLAQLATRLGADTDPLRQRLKEDRASLLAVRNQRVRPARDDKVLLAWNAMTITALCKGFRALREVRFLNAAQEIANFIRREMRQTSGRLYHTWREGRASLPGYLDDYATLLDALLELYQCDFDVQWLSWACELGELIEARFRDPLGGYFFTADDQEQLITRYKDGAESSVPSGNAMAASGLLALGRLLDRDEFVDAAYATLRSTAALLAEAPQAAAQSLRALDRWLDAESHWVLIGGDDEHEWLEACAACRQVLLPHGIILGTRSTSDVPGLLAPYFAGRSAFENRTTLFMCRGKTCRTPVAGLADIRLALVTHAAPERGPT